MDEYRSGRRSRAQERQTHLNSGEGIHFLLRAEDQIVQSISARAPLSGLLDKICSALDCQIGNMISLILLAEDGAGNLATIAENADRLGLHTFCSEGIVAGSDELLGSLHMYCSVARSPSAVEIQLIERAKCLAAIAIKLENETGQQGNLGTQGNQPVRGHLLEWPVSVN